MQLYPSETAAFPKRLRSFEDITFVRMSISSRFSSWNILLSRYSNRKWLYSSRQWQYCAGILRAKLISSAGIWCSNCVQHRRNAAGGDGRRKVRRGCEDSIFFNRKRNRLKMSYFAGENSRCHDRQWLHESSDRNISCAWRVRYPCIWFLIFISPKKFIVCF